VLIAEKLGMTVVDAHDLQMVKISDSAIME